MLVGRAKYPGKEELAEMAAADAAGTNGKDAGEKKHKRKTYGRKVEIKKRRAIDACLASRGRGPGGGWAVATGAVALVD